MIPQTFTPFIVDGGEVSARKRSATGSIHAINFCTQLSKLLKHLIIAWA